MRCHQFNMWNPARGGELYDFVYTDVSMSIYQSPPACGVASPPRCTSTHQNHGSLRFNPDDTPRRTSRQLNPTPKGPVHLLDRHGQL